MQADWGTSSPEAGMLITARIQGANKFLRGGLFHPFHSSALLPSSQLARKYILEAKCGWETVLGHLSYVLPIVHRSWSPDVL
jgi:hypothetical protein